MSLQPLLVSALSAQQEATYRQGRLSNGLTYYIRHNAAEPGLASFFGAARRLYFGNATPARLGAFPRAHGF